MMDGAGLHPVCRALFFSEIERNKSSHKRESYILTGKLRGLHMSTSQKPVMVDGVENFHLSHDDFSSPIFYF